MNMRIVILMSIITALMFSFTNVNAYPYHPKSTMKVDCDRVINTDSNSLLDQAYHLQPWATPEVEKQVSECYKRKFAKPKH